MRVTVVQEQRARGKPYNAQDAFKRLRKHALDFAADETGSSEIEVRKRKHAALNAALFLFVKGHDHEHGNDRGRHRGDGLQAGVPNLRRIAEEKKGQTHKSPSCKGEGQKPVCKSFLTAALLPKDNGHGEKDQRGRNRDRNAAEEMHRIGRGPESQDSSGYGGRDERGFALRIQLGAQQEKKACESVKPLIESVLRWPVRHPLGESRAKVVKGEQAPTGGPKKQIDLALEFENIGEETRYQGSGGEQRNVDEALMCQRRNRFSAQRVDGCAKPQKCGKNNCASRMTRNPAPPTQRQPCAASSRSVRCTRQSTGNYGLQNFQEASVPQYW